MKNVLIVGGGAREHAIAFTLKKSKQVNSIYAIPGNGGMAQIATCIDGSVTDFEKILKIVEEKQIDLTVIGPEVPLCKGLADYLEERNHLVFGVRESAAKLEGSKAVCKKFLMDHQIPTAKYVEVESFEDGVEALKNFSYPVVVKADGLAAGKGVVICNSKEEAISTLHSMMVEHEFQEAGNKVVMEEFLKGFECSLLAFVDGKTIVPMVSAKDHKQIYDGNKGPNTGGMGSVSPNPFLDEAFEEKVNKEVLVPFMKGLQEEQIDYRGVIFIGLMIDQNDLKVLEFNVRFGDPETQAILLRLESDLYTIMEACATKTLSKDLVKWKDVKSACVVLASKGYPGAYEKGKLITGLDQVSDDVVVFHAGSIYKDNHYYTNGGRVLSICACGKDQDEALNKVYQAIEKIDFEGKQYRKDIGRV